MITGEKHRGNFFSAPLDRSCVLRIFQQIVLQRFKPCRIIVRKYPGHKPGNHIDHNSSPQFSAGHHVIADGQILINTRIKRALVDPFIMTAEKDQTFLSGELFRLRLREHFGLRSEVDHLRLSAGSLFCRLDSTHNRFRLHDHACAAAIGIVVHSSVGSLGIIADIDGMQPENAFFYCTSRNTCVDDRINQIRKKC